jgi:hypothetical protein
MIEKIKNWWIRWDMTWADLVISLVCLYLLYLVAIYNKDVFVGILIGLYFGYQGRKIIQQTKSKYLKSKQKLPKE